MWTAIGIAAVSIVTAAFLSLVIIAVKESAERDYEQVTQLAIVGGGKTLEQLARRGEDRDRLWRQSEVLLEELSEFYTYFAHNTTGRQTFRQNRRYLTLTESVAKLLTDCSSVDRLVADRYREPLRRMRQALSRPGIGFDAAADELDTAADELRSVVEEDKSS